MLSRLRTALAPSFKRTFRRVVPLAARKRIAVTIGRSGLPGSYYWSMEVIRDLASQYPGPGDRRFGGLPAAVADSLVDAGLGAAVEPNRPLCPGELRVGFDEVRTTAGGQLELAVTFASAPPRERAVELERRYVVECLFSSCRVVAVRPGYEPGSGLAIDPGRCRQRNGG